MKAKTDKGSKMFFYTSANVAERLNFLWSSLILLVFALMIGVLRFLYLPSLISCWTPASFENTHTLYALQTCWNQNYTYLKLENSVPTYGSRLSKIETFHSVIPVIVVLMMIGFKIPEAIKVLLDICTGSKPKSLIALTDSWEGRSKSLAEFGRSIVQESGIMKTLSFFLVKIFILINLFVQYFFVRSYFKDSVSRSVVNGSATEIRRVLFPKMIMCDFEIQMQARSEYYTVQCQMPVNHLYEEFFRIYNYWILGVGLFTGAMFLFQLGTLMVSPLVGVRFHGIIPEKELKMRGFSVDDSLLFLEEVRDEYGIVMARSVASKMWDAPKLVEVQSGELRQSPVFGADGFQEIPMTNIQNSAADSSISPLLDDTKSDKKN